MTGASSGAGGGGSQRPPRKSRDAFRTISEVSRELDVAQHVLRFWETKFRQVRPLKRAGGRRFYRPEDVELLRRIKVLLRDQRLTIEGVQKLLNSGKVPIDAPLDEFAFDELLEALDEPPPSGDSRPAPPTAPSQTSFLAEADEAGEEPRAEMRARAAERVEAIRSAVAELRQLRDSLA